MARGRGRLDAVKQVSKKTEERRLAGFVRSLHHDHRMIEILEEAGAEWPKRLDPTRGDAHGFVLGSA
jgi:hypothetical protein